jgi:hypothetical protein
MAVMRTRTSQVIVPIAAAALAVLGLIALGRAARDGLRQHERYTVAFADMDCPNPPGMTRDEFLAEVQYLARLPDRLAALDEQTPLRIASAFAQHPWVQKVEEVRIVQPDGARVRLVFRTPVLAVPQPNGLRVVDSHGILLPASAPTEGLRIYQGNAAPPTGLAGDPWGDPAVTAAAEAASNETAKP